jgi:hypothetical protein
MAEELVELTAAIQHELELARSGDGYEEGAVAGEIVERMVAPMLAARDASFDQRLSDFREEYRKSLESWDRTRERLTGELAGARGKLGEAQGNHWAAREELARVEASRQAWAEEAMAVREKLARLENMVLNRSAALFSGILVGVGGEHDTPPNDEQTWRAVGLIERAIRREMGPGYITQAEERLVSAVESNGVCACVTDEQAAQIESAGPLWVRPQCAVHPEALDLTDDEPPEVWVEAPDDADYSLLVHPEGGTA